MAYTSGIHLHTILFEDDVEYGEFVSPTKNAFQGSQEASNVESNIDKNVFWAIIFPKYLVDRSKWYPW
jgi:hypothetical protein